MTDPVSNGAAESADSTVAGSSPAHQPAPPLRLLSQDERNDLRKRVLAGETMSLEDAKAVIDTIRQGRGAAALVAETKPKKSRAKKPGLSDEELNASLDAKLGL
jgi:hypothetical protein